MVKRAKIAQFGSVKTVELNRLADFARCDRKENAVSSNDIAEAYDLRSKSYILSICSNDEGSI